MGRPGIRCVAIYWKQLRLTLDLCFLSYPIWNLISWRSKGETTFTIIYIHLLSVFLLTSARPNSNKCILQQYSSSKLGAQAIPLKNLVSRTGEGHSIQILSVATLQAKRIVYSPSNTLIDWLTYYLWLRPRAIFVRGVHRGAFAQQQLRSRHVAVARRLVQRRHASGAEADVPRGRRTLWAAELYARSTDKRTMNVLDSTPSNCAKQNIFTHNHKHIEQGSWHFVSNKLPSMKRCLLLIL